MSTKIFKRYIYIISKLFSLLVVNNYPLSRLSEGRNLGNLTEVPLPVRFIFILMGPNESNLDYHEIGRSISTLLANTVSRLK